jgi:predicted alpha/beta-fold hydrolase
MFRPLPFLTHRHLQTILAAKMYLPLEPPSVTRLVRLADGDQIALEISTPHGWQPDAPTVVLLHGLCGCHRSTYMRRLAYKAWRRGMRAVRMNLRGCGSGRGLARQLYHSGRSEDVHAVLRLLHADIPDAPLTLLGFSLGGNIALKLAGELRDTAAAYLQQVIAVCPPADLAACVRLLAHPSNRLYERHFMRRLRADVIDRHRLFPDLPPAELPQELSLYAFDNLYTAPRCGFRNAEDYYARCSAAPLVPDITIPCRILFAADDPFIDATVFDGVKLPASLQLIRTQYGGHLGFLGWPGRAGGYRWMDTLLLDWLQSTGRRASRISVDPGHGYPL